MRPIAPPHPPSSPPPSSPPSSAPSPQMGHATAEAVIRAGLTLVPFSFTGRSEAVAVGNVGVCGVPVELITPPERQAALDKIRGEYPDLVVVDYTLPSAVNGKREGERKSYLSCFFDAGEMHCMRQRGGGGAPSAINQPPPCFIKLHQFVNSPLTHLLCSLPSNLTFPHCRQCAVLLRQQAALRDGHHRRRP